MAYAQELPQESLGSFSNSTKASLKDFFTLTKPGVLFLVVYTAFVGFLIAPSNQHPFISFVSLLSIALASAGAATFNMWYDRDMDAMMVRTQKRPIPAGLIAPQDALTFGNLLMGTALFLMILAGHYMATFWLAFSMFFYTVIYTILLKRATPQNIVIGGAAGSFPPVIAWVAQTGSLSIEPLILFLLIFIWTPSHFWALALYRSNDYAVAKVPMLPVTHGVASTTKHILIYSALLVASSALPYTIHMAGNIYAWSALFLGLPYMFLAFKLYFKPQSRTSMMLFTYSIFYLFLLFTALAVDHFI